jgi:hypothetical protein
LKHSFDSTYIANFGFRMEEKMVTLGLGRETPKLSPPLLNKKTCAQRSRIVLQKGKGPK